MEMNFAREDSSGKREEWREGVDLDELGVNLSHCKPPLAPPRHAC